MRWIAACATALVLAGCESPQRAQPDHRLPDPLTTTASRPQPRQYPVVRAPRAPQPAVRRTPPRPVPPPRVVLRPEEIIPPGGIQRKWEVFVVHHSTSANDTPEGMDRYHREDRGWRNGLGYHFVIGNGVNTEDGRVYVGSRWKRQITGAHCATDAGKYVGAYRPKNYFNARGIGICLVGNFETSSPTPRQLAALQQLINFLSPRTGVSTRAVYGHGEVTHRTACPGRNLKPYVGRFRSDGSIRADAGHKHETLASNR